MPRKITNPDAPATPPTIPDVAAAECGLCGRVVNEDGTVEEGCPGFSDLKGERCHRWGL